MVAVVVVVVLVIAATIGLLIRANRDGHSPARMMPPPSWRDVGPTRPAPGAPLPPLATGAPRPPADGTPLPRDPVASRPNRPGDRPAPPPGFTTTWVDRFDGRAGTGLSRRVYQYSFGRDFGTGEIAEMTDSTRNVLLDGQGHLVLRALRSGERRHRSGWTSGRIETRDATFGASAGGILRVEARLRQPDVSRETGAGYWPAFWMLGGAIRNGVPWPRMGGVDIMEGVNGRESVFGTLHCGQEWNGPCQEPDGIGSGERPCAGCETGFHTYAVEIDRSQRPERIRWYLDGTNYFTVTQSSIDAAAWADAVHQSYFLILDLFIGGDMPRKFGGGPDDRTVSGGSLIVDYLAVFNRR
jgi:beta-glucanase (GH16 family)